MATANAILFAVSTIVAFVVVELALRVVLHEEYFVWPPNLEATFHPAPEIFPGIKGASRVQINASGMRGDPMPPGDVYRILAVGGSTTECLYLDQDEAWPQVLQARMNDARGDGRVWVGSVGRSGRNARHHVLQIEKLLETHPRIDLVIVLVGVNDLTLRLSADADEPVAPEMSEKLMNEAFAVHQDLDALLPFYKRLMIWRMARQVKRNFVAPSNYFHYQSDTGTEYVAWRAERQRAARIRGELPDLSVALAEYEANLRAMIGAAQAHGVEIVMMTQPAMWRADLPEEAQKLLWLGGVGQFHVGSATEYYSASALAEGMEQYNAVLRRVCAEMKVECVDLAAVIPRDTTAFYDDVHFNEAGARMVADSVADVLVKTGSFAAPASRP